MSRTRETVENILSNKASNESSVGKKVSTKNAKMAAKVQLMKLKQNAEGGAAIAPDQRVYLRVHFPSKKVDNISSKNVFVSKKFSVGKVIDSLAEICQIQNSNNSSKVDKKLRIFRRIDGGIWSNDLTEILETMLDTEKAFNGESIILEYSANFESLEDQVYKLYESVKWIKSSGVGRKSFKTALMLCSFDAMQLKVLLIFEKTSPDLKCKVDKSVKWTNSSQQIVAAGKSVLF